MHDTGVVLRPSSRTLYASHPTHVHSSISHHRCLRRRRTQHRRNVVRTRGGRCRETDEGGPSHDGTLVEMTDSLGRRTRLENDVRIIRAIDVNEEVRVLRRTCVSPCTVLSNSSTAVWCSLTGMLLMCVITIPERIPDACTKSCGSVCVTSTPRPEGVLPTVTPKKVPARGSMTTALPLTGSSSGSPSMG